MNRKMAIGITVLVVAIVVLVIIVGGNRSESTTVRIGYLRLTANLPLFVALENAYFEETGLRVEAIPFESSNQMVDALIAGRIDVETAASSSVVVTVAQTVGDEIQVFMLNVFTPENFLSSLLVKKGSGLKSIQDLDGKIIGTFPGSTMRMYTELLLKEKGVSPSEIVQLTPPTQLAALENGSVDALMTLEPLGTLGEIKGIATRIEQGPVETYVHDPWVAGTNSFSARFVNEHPEEARQIQAALYKAVDYIRSNPGEAKKLLPQYTPVTDEGLATKLTLPNYWKRSEMNLAEFQRMADTLLENGIIEKKVEVSCLLIPE